MFILTRQQVSIVPGVSELVTEASTAGFPVGDWPEIVSVVDERNEGFVFFRQRKIDSDSGEFAGWRYITKDGEVSLLIFND
jgi:hypothetical protein